ncbi:hypothetical protein, partial [Komagataeibacter europaeus]|uniref:hypothetical protein n=1 Tax=Komagataeibacter europaeus TaxID=33995 RepID=UPI0022311EC1
LRTTGSRPHHQFSVKINNLVFYRLQEMMNPGYLRRYELGIQQNQGQKFWLSPTWNPYQAMAGR